MDKLNDLFTKIITKLNKKVDSVEGKQLSSEDFTSEEKTKLQGIADEAQVNTIETITLNGTNVEPDGEKNVEIKAYNEDNKPEVGGRNYFGFNKGIFFNPSGCAVFDQTINGVQIVGHNALLHRIQNLGFDSVAGNYTVSFWAKANSEIAVAIDICDANPQEITIPVEYQKFTLTAFAFSWNSPTNMNGFFDIECNLPEDNIIYIKDLKIERGVVPTDWSPAPEDLETTAENFEGILPIVKGGTGNATGNITVQYPGTGGFASLRSLTNNQGNVSMLGCFAGETEETWSFMGATSGAYSKLHNIAYTIRANGEEIGTYKGNEIAVKADILPYSNEQKILAQIANRTYQGTDLTVKFKSEIDGSFNGNPWAWVQDRINNANWDGLHVCDYIPFTTAGLETNVTMQAQIAGMDTYYQYGDPRIPHHIDFITREIWPTVHTFNPVNYNNGTATQNYPWLASDMYLWLNSKAGTVPNATTVNPETTEVDYTADGVYYFLPEELKAVIIEKRFLLETRYNASSLLTTSPGWGWQNEGKLWLPTEMEVYGTNVWGGAGCPTGGGIQYPIFANSMNRLKYRNGGRADWWFSIPYSGDSERWCYASADGHAGYNAAVNTWLGAPVCFRIASTVKTADMPVEGPEMMDEHMQHDEVLSPEFEKPIDRSPETEDEPLTE